MSYHSNDDDDHSPLINDAASRQDGRVNGAIEGPQNQLPRWFTTIIWIVAIVILTATGSYCSLELYYLATIRKTTSCGSSNIISNSILMVYLSLVIVVVMAHLMLIYMNPNWLDKTKFRNYPMLITLILIACIDITYYTMMLLKNVAIGDQILSISFTVTEFIFNGAILPFIILCVCYIAYWEYPGKRMTMVTTIFACIGGCLMLFVKRFSSKIIRVFNVSCDTRNSEYQLKIENTEYILNRVDTTYILMGMVLLVYSSLNYRRPPDDSPTNHDSLISKESNQSTTTVDFLAIITFMKYRWPTLTISTILVVLYLCCTNILFMVLESNIPNKDNYQILFLSVNMVVYIACIAYTLVYFLTDNSSVTNLSGEDTRTDPFFATFFAIVKILHGASLIGYYIWFYHGNTFTTACKVEISTLVIMIIQIIAQLWYIISCHRTGVSNCNSRWFPPIALAVFNFGFLVHNILYPGSDGCVVTKDLAQKLVHSIIENVISPMSLLYRVHGMAFFINLTWKHLYE